MAWFGPEATHVAVSPDDLRAVGVERPTTARLVDVAIRAALGTGAAVRMIPSDVAVPEHIGALLRWSA